MCTHFGPASVSRMDGVAMAKGAETGNKVSRIGGKSL